MANQMSEPDDLRKSLNFAHSALLLAEAEAARRRATLLELQAMWVEKYGTESL